MQVESGIQFKNAHEIRWRGDIPCIDEVNETVSGKVKWSKKATEEMKRLNSDCNLTAGLEAVLQVAIGAHAMLCRNIDISKGLVNGAFGSYCHFN